MVRPWRESGLAGEPGKRRHQGEQVDPVHIGARRSLGLSTEQTSSNANVLGVPGLTAYAASKAARAVSCFRRVELREWGGFGCRRRLLGHLKSADLGECMIAKALTEIR